MPAGPAPHDLFCDHRASRRRAIRLASNRLAIARLSAAAALDLNVRKTILKIYELGLVFVLVFLAFLYFFLAREMCFVPISFFTILHFPPRATCGQGKCKIVKNKTGARKTYKNAKNTKTKNNMSLKFNKNRFPDTNLQRAKALKYLTN